MLEGSSGMACLGERRADIKLKKSPDSLSRLELANLLIILEAFYYLLRRDE